MGISEITNQGGLPPLDNGKKPKEPPRSPQSKKDKVDLSAEAKSLFESGQSKRLEEIQRKVRENFYFQRDVTEQVADSLLKDLIG